MAAPCGSGFYPRKPRCGPPDTPRQTLRGRARSHRDRWQSLWERVLPAKVPLRSARYNVANPSRAEPAPTGIDGSPCGSGFYPRKPHRGSAATTRQILRGQSPLPQGSMAVLVGAGSTREGRAAVHQIHRAKSFAGRARSHRIDGTLLWERVLPAKATPRFCRYNAPNSSQAEPAPTGISATQGGSCSAEGAA